MSPTAYSLHLATVECPTMLHQLHWGGCSTVNSNVPSLVLLRLPLCLLLRLRLYTEVSFSFVVPLTMWRQVLAVTAGWLCGWGTSAGS